MPLHFPLPSFSLSSLSCPLLFPVCVLGTSGFDLSLHCSSVPQNSLQEIRVEDLLSEGTGTCVKMNCPSNFILCFTVSLKQECSHIFSLISSHFFTSFTVSPSTPVPWAFSASFSLTPSVAGPGRAWTGAPGLSLQICV